MATISTKTSGKLKLAQLFNVKGKLAIPTIFMLLKSGVIVGHIPKKISATFSLFLRRGGAIHCTATGAKRYSADLEQGGLEVPCVLKFVGDEEKLKFLLDKTQKLVSNCYALSKDKVHLKQQSVNPNEESKSVSESDSVPQTKKIKLSESCETLTDWQRDRT